MGASSPWFSQCCFSCTHWSIFAFSNCSVPLVFVLFWFIVIWWCWMFFQVELFSSLLVWASGWPCVDFRIFFLPEGFTSFWSRFRLCSFFVLSVTDVQLHYFLVFGHWSVSSSLFFQWMIPLLTKSLSSSSLSNWGPTQLLFLPALCIDFLKKMKQAW